MQRPGQPWPVLLQGGCMFIIQLNIFPLLQACVGWQDPETSLGDVLPCPGLGREVHCIFADLALKLLTWGGGCWG